MNSSPPMQIAIALVGFLTAGRIGYAEPPKLTALFPAGVQVGQTTKVTAQGTFANWPVQTWVDREGLVVEADAEHKGDFRISAKADSSTGLYWIRAYDAEGASSLRPFIVGTIPEFLELEPNDSLSQAQALSGSSTVNGQLAKLGDVDGFAVELQAGQVCVASVTANGLLGSPMDTVINVTNRDGIVLAQVDDERGMDPQLVFRAPRTEKFIIRAFAFPVTPDSSIAFAGAETFIYRLTVSCGPFIDHVMPLAATAGKDTEFQLFGWNLPNDFGPIHLTGKSGKTSWMSHPQAASSIAIEAMEVTQALEAADNSPSKPQVVSVPLSISGRIEAAEDIDAFKFVGKAGQSLAIAVGSRSLGAALDGHLLLNDAAGKIVTEADDVGLDVDPALVFKVPSDGEYTVQIRDVFRHGGFRYYYRLSILESRPNFSLTIKDDSFVAVVGKPLEIPITIDRQNGFAGDVTIQALGLPEGVAVSSVKSVSKDESAKNVKLTLTAEKMTAAAAIQIVGTVDGETAQRIATFSSPGFSNPHDAIWLTVKR